MSLIINIFLATLIAIGNLNSIKSDVISKDDNDLGLYYNKKGKFKIWMPCEKPEVEKNKIKSDLGVIKLYTFKCLHENSVFMVGYSDYPEEYMKYSKDEDLLEGAKNGFIKELKLEVTSEEWINVSSYKGKVFKARSQEYTASVKHLIVKNRLYQFVIMTKDKEINQIDENKFFSSLILYDK
ncbi:MAG: hypothetical protein Kow0068_02320 [Marinilabiliales bacterium]